MKKIQYIWASLRLGIGWIFLWSFLDKLFGLGFSTVPDKAWIQGVSPTTSFLKFGTHGPFSEIFQDLAGCVIVDWLFMMGLLFVGLALILGIGVKIAGYFGSLMMLLIWLSLFPPEHNPFLDEHIIYIIIFLGLGVTESGQWFGLGKWWASTALVKKYPILE